MRQQGVALISVLLVVVIATVLSVSMIRHQNLTIHKARNVYDQAQAAQYALGGEELARQILWQDFKDAPEVDHLQEDWADKELFFEFEDGDVSVEINDLQGRFNINSLALAGDAGRNAQLRFSQLLQLVGSDSMYLDRAIDWIDDDISTRPLGAEDYDYLGLELPYRSGGHAYIDLTELRLLLDMDADTFEQLQPYLSALPEAATPINVNTADAGVLQSVSRQLTSEASSELINEREAQQGYESVTEFLKSSYVAGLGVKETGLSVQSSFFEVRVRSRYLERYGYLTSIIQRNFDGTLSVIFRNLSRKVFPNVALEENQV